MPLITYGQLQDGLSEMSLLLQTLQAASYDGTFIWKIPEVTRRRQEARTGKTVSLYSAPFYMSRHGYKACLRLYMNGDGAGKGTHLSFFITLMRGEYDALSHVCLRLCPGQQLLCQGRHHVPQVQD